MPQRKRRPTLTDAEVEAEIARLNASPEVKLALSERKKRARRRNRLYQLRYLEEHGKELARMGISESNLDDFVYEDMKGGFSGMKNSHPRADLYRSYREKGMTYRQIAEICGVTIQTVQKAIMGTPAPGYFRHHSSVGVVYPGLRTWMNVNKVSMRALLALLGMQPGGTTHLRHYLTGHKALSMPLINKLIAVTGLTYEQLFLAKGADHD